MESIFVFGASGHAKVILDLLEQAGQHQVVGLLDPYKEKGSRFFGYPVLGAGRDDLPALCALHQCKQGVLALGDNALRRQVAEEILRLVPDFHFISACHPSAVLGRGVEIGPGSLVMAGVVINPDCRIGAHVVVNTRASLDHDCLVQDYASIAPGVVMGGGVEVGQGSAVGLGAHVIHGKKIGREVVLGAGAVVVSDLPDEVVAMGVPARVIRGRQRGEKYL